jgi:hypothetical protein
MSDVSYHANDREGGYDVVMDGARVGLVHDTVDGWAFWLPVDRPLRHYRLAAIARTRLEAVTEGLLNA